MVTVLYCPSPLGRIALAGEGETLTGLWLEGQKYFAASLAPGDWAEGELPVLTRAARWLEEYFRGNDPDLTGITLAPAGTPFQQKVWRRLRDIPRGTTVTYGQLASELGSSPRAVGSAVGRNPISILIPCHRVVGADGSLTGYAGGVDRKEFLLRLEGAI